MILGRKPFLTGLSDGMSQSHSLSAGKNESRRGEELSWRDVQFGSKVGSLVLVLFEGSVDVKGLSPHGSLSGASPPQGLTAYLWPHHQLRVGQRSEVPVSGKEHQEVKKEQVVVLFRQRGFRSCGTVV